MIYRELPSGEGFADLAFLPRKGVSAPAMVVELKVTKAAGTALKQIKEKKYTEGLKDYTGEVLLVGISYEKGKKKHCCRIERIRIEK